MAVAFEVVDADPVSNNHRNAYDNALRDKVIDCFDDYIGATITPETKQA